MSDENENGTKSFRHSFHLPNFFSRGTGASGAPYEQVRSTEGDDGDDDDNEDTAEDADGAAAASAAGAVGAASCDSWQSTSPMQRMLFKAAFCIFGASVLLPFNAVITPSEYYRSLVGSRFSASVMSWIIVAYNVSSIVFGAHAAASMERASISGRVLFSASFVIGLLAVATGLTNFVPAASPGEDTSSSTAFALFVVLSCSLAGLVSYLQMAVVTLANAWGPAFMGLMLAGQGVVGLVVSAIQLGAALSSSTKFPVAQAQQRTREARAASQFFGANTLLMALALATFAFVSRTQVFREVAARRQRGSKPHHADHENAAGSPEEEEARSISGLNRYLSPATRRQHGELRRTQAKVMVPSLALAYVFVVTLAVFPSLTSRVRPWSLPSLPPSSPALSQQLIFVAWHFVAFNACDLIGRTVPSLLPVLFSTLSQSFLLVLSLLRTVLVPLLLACHIPDPRPHAPNISASSFGDAIFFTLVCLLGLSNGLVATSIFITAPRSDVLRSPAEKGRAAALLSWWLTLGLAVGSLASFAF